MERPRYDSLNVEFFFFSSPFWQLFRSRVVHREETQGGQAP